MTTATEREMDIFEENEAHPMRIETRDVKFENSEIDASKINFSDRTMMIETILELKDMGVLSEFTC